MRAITSRSRTMGGAKYPAQHTFSTPTPAPHGGGISSRRVKTARSYDPTGGNNSRRGHRQASKGKFSGAYAGPYSKQPSTRRIAVGNENAGRGNKGSGY